MTAHVAQLQQVLLRRLAEIESEAAQVRALLSLYTGGPISPPRESQTAILREYMAAHPAREFRYPDVVRWASTRHADVRRFTIKSAVKELHEQGQLIRTARGLYVSAPDATSDPTPEP